MSFQSAFEENFGHHRDISSYILASANSGNTISIYQHSSANAHILTWGHSISKDKAMLENSSIFEYGFMRSKKENYISAIFIEYDKENDRIVELFRFSKHQLDQISAMREIYDILQGIFSNQLEHPSKVWKGICTKWINIWFRELIKQGETKCEK